MGEIQILNDILANQIAAGEVVERPASVVKELVENSLDAGATRIEVHLEEAGLTSIRVIDNGRGMAPEDAALAFERHATSKIKTDKDLFRISTLGFRGEALPSIAAVASVTLKTQPMDSVSGTLICIEGGIVTENKSIGLSQGTEIEVRDLFYNTPARLKYVKSIQTELGHSVDFLQKMSLAHPHVAFSLFHHDRNLLRTVGDHVTEHAMAAIYGRDMVRQLLRIHRQTPDYKVEGLVSTPEYTRSGRSHMHFFVNGRPIRNFLLTNAVLDGYQNRLPLHRFPLVAIQITLDPVLVDVNVHPTKMEVRFSEEKDVLEQVRLAVHEVLHSSLQIPKATASTLYTPPPSKQPDRKMAESRPAMQISMQAAMQAMEAYQPVNGEIVSETAVKAEAEALPILEQETVEQILGERPSLRPVAQVLGMYIVAEAENGLYIIDQHAAHEKILYEQFSRQMRQKDVRSMQLLVPFSLDLSPADAERLIPYLPLLHQCALEVEPFGNNSFLIRAVPDIWRGNELQKHAEDMISEVLKEHQLPNSLSYIEDKIVLKSCKAALKANHWLSMPEMIALCDQLIQLENPYQCPHGRPIMIHMSPYDLEKQFKRVM